MQELKDSRSLGELFAELARETGALVQKELELTRVEMTEKAGRAGRNVGSLAAGGAILYAGFLALLAAAIAGLATQMPWWLAAAIVGVVVAAVGYALVRRALDALQRDSLAPQETIRTLREDADWAKEQVG